MLSLEKCRLSLFKKTRDFPLISLRNSLMLLRMVTAILFAAHAVTRIAKGTILQFGQFMESAGFPFGVAWVWGITIAEIIAAVLLVTNRYVRPAAAVLFIIAFTGIILIHRHFGWFVGEHGTGGAEYSVALLMMLLVIGAADRESQLDGLGRTANEND
jgi:putative oxidoreductase